MRDLLRSVVDIARAAGQATLEVRNDGFDVELKADESPVTVADLKSSEIVVDGLAKLDPTTPIICEETDDADFETRKTWRRYWLVDPLDGTKSFIKGTDDYAVLIGLIDNGYPVLGVIHAPAMALTYYGGVGIGAFKVECDGPAQEISCRQLISGVLPTVIVSRSHPSGRLDQYLNKLPEHKISKMSSALKMGAVASGNVDIYPRLKDLWDWDTAAGQAIVEAAGGRVVDEHGQRLVYNQRADLIQPTTLAIADASVDWLQYLPQSNSSASTAA